MAAKWALGGFGESLRADLRGRPGIHVCTLLPASIDTPLFQHAANFTGRAAKPLRPIIHPGRVAAAVVRCAKRPKREVTVGLSGRQMLAFLTLAPALFERVMTKNVEREHFRADEVPATRGNLRDPMPDWTGVTGGWKEGDASPEGEGPDPKARWAGAATTATTVSLSALALLVAALRR